MSNVEGFRHRSTGCLYFSAAAQAAEAAGPTALAMGVDADCQAHYTRAEAAQTAEIDTQTPAPGTPAHAGRILTVTGAHWLGRSAVLYRCLAPDMRQSSST